MNDIFRFEFDFININLNPIVEAFDRAVDRGFYRDILSNIYQIVTNATVMIRSHGRRDIPPRLIENTNQFPIQGPHYRAPGMIRNDPSELIFPVLDIAMDNQEANQISRDLWNDPPSLTEIKNRIQRLWKRPPFHPLSYFYFVSATIVIFAFIKSKKHTR
ncbi:hypothetical protein BDC45DRAFT_596998 [Circinella umbellata]|nr:hypothetical protein BDC45DRAFT_596998 [Circinella umbellata]